MKRDIVLQVTEEGSTDAPSPDLGVSALATLAFMITSIKSFVIRMH